MASVIKVLECQSLFDIAVMVCGSANAAFNIALENGISVTDTLTPGQELTIPDDIILQRDVAGYFLKKNILPATAKTEEQYANTIGGEGIEFWTIEQDFEVS